MDVKETGDSINNIKATIQEKEEIPPDQAVRNWRRLLIAMSSVSYRNKVPQEKPAVKKSARASSTQSRYMRISESETESFCHNLTCELGLRQLEKAVLAQCMNCWGQDGFEIIHSNRFVYTTRTGQKLHLDQYCGNSKTAIPHRVCSHCLPTV